MLTKRFFAEIFLTFGVIFLLINLMMHFNYGNFNDTQYFGVTTLIEILNPQNASSQQMVTNINSYMEWVNDAIPEFTQSITSFRNMLFSVDDEVASALGLSGIAQGVWFIVKAFTYVIQFVGVIGMYMVLVIMYIVYLLDAFTLLISGNWVAVKPTAYWTYPPVHFSYGFIM